MKIKVNRSFFDFVDKDDDDDEYILATMLFDNHCIAMSSNPRWDGSTFAMNPWETKSVWLNSFEVGKHLKGLGFGEAALTLFMREVIPNKKYLALTPIEKAVGFYKKLGFEYINGMCKISLNN